MVIFIDLDGTLVDVSLRHFIWISEFLKAHTMTVKFNLNQYWELRKKGFTDPEIINKFYRVKISTGEYNPLKSSSIESKEFLKYDHLFEYTIECLKHLSQRHEVNLMSHRSNKRDSKNQLKKFKINQYFYHILLTPKSGAKKDQLIKRHINFNPEESVIIGDSEADLIAAKILGVGYYLLTSGVRNKQYFISKGVKRNKIFSDLKHCISKTHL